MAQKLKGQWPWESGAMPKAMSTPKPDRREASPPPYRLPTVQDRRAEGGGRPARVRDLVRLRDERLNGGEGPFRW